VGRYTPVSRSQYPRPVYRSKYRIRNFDCSGSEKIEAKAFGDVREVAGMISIYPIIPFRLMVFSRPVIVACFFCA